MKIVIICILFLIGSGCGVMVKENYLLVDSKDTWVRTNSCSEASDTYGSNHGYGIKTKIELDDSIFELCSIAYSRKIASVGPIIPVIPTGEDTTVLRKLRWVKVKNKSPDINVIISKIDIEGLNGELLLYEGPSLPPYFTQSSPPVDALLYCRHSDTLFHKRLFLRPEDSVWVGFPNLPKLTI